MNLGALGVAVEAAVLTLLLLALLGRIVVQLTARPTRPKLLQTLDLAATTLLGAFVIIVLQRFSDLS